jgi:hypothetical protein
MLNKFKNSIFGNPVTKMVAIGGGIYLTYTLFNKLFGNAQATSNALIQTKASTELENFLKTQKLSYLPSQYEQFANIIYNSTMYGLGDNYTAVRDTMKLMKNNADVAKLITAYGSRQNYVFGIPQGEKKDLFTNIRAELGDEFFGIYTQKLEDIRADWKKKKITYQL